MQALGVGGKSLRAEGFDVPGSTDRFGKRCDSERRRAGSLKNRLSGSDSSSGSDQ